MILLQSTIKVISTTSSGPSQAVSFWFYVEILLIIAVILYQIYHSRNVFLSIKQLENIFSKPLKIKSAIIELDKSKKKIKTLDDVVVIDGEDTNSDSSQFDPKFVKISIAETSGKGIIRRICVDLNNYLINNHGADVNFAIIKDIIDREVDIKDEEISHSIPTPLYLGLAATMIGIIFGLFSMPDLGGAKFSEGIDALINGVKLAMFGSLSGLACTTALSSFFYKSAKNKVLVDKNSQISYLQATLLPELLKGEVSGITGLKNIIENFARDATGMIDNLQKTAITTLQNLESQTKITDKQYEIIRKIEGIDVVKVTRANVELFNKLDQNAHSFGEFAKYIELMGQISMQLKDFANRTASIDRITNHIDDTLKENRQLTEFLSNHFARIENAGNAALRAVDLADAHFNLAIKELESNTLANINNTFAAINESSAGFANAINHLINEIQTRTQNVNHQATDHESKIVEIYNDIEQKLKGITEEYLRHLEETFKDSSPRFDDLKHLNELPIIREQVFNNPKGQEVIGVIEGLNESVLKVKDGINQKGLLDKLSSIEDLLKKRRGGPGPNPPIPKPETKPETSGNLPLFSALSEVFKRKQNGN